jgi:DNA-binding Lrp family transcriptional regulator
MLDRLDLAILKAILVNNGVPPGVPVLRKSFRSMAKDLGVDQGTIRARMKKFQAQGVLKGWNLGTDPANNGQSVGQAWLGSQNESDKARAIDALLSSREVERVCNYFGPTLSFVFLIDKGAEARLILGRLLRRVGPAMTLLREGVMPLPKRVLKDFDTSIIQSLRKNPWKSYQMVARETKASSKTIARRVSRMSEEGAIYMLPVVDLKALHGIIPAELVVEYSATQSKETSNAHVVSKIGQDLVFSNIAGPYGYFALLVENLSQLEHLAEWCRKQEGVEGIRVNALQDVILNPVFYPN